MPRARAKNSEGLWIALKNPEGFFVPGSKVVGDVQLNTVQDFAIGSVVVELYGRVKGICSPIHALPIITDLDSSIFRPISWRGRESLAWSCPSVLPASYSLRRLPYP